MLGLVINLCMLKHTLNNQCKWVAYIPCVLVSHSLVDPLSTISVPNQLKPLNLTHQPMPSNKCTECSETGMPMSDAAI